MSYPIRVGIKLAPQLTSLESLRAVWRIGEDAGFDHIWIFDHFAALGSNPAGPIFEAWTLLAAMAQATSRARIGVMVSGNLYRHPGVLAKMAVTVDHVSNGRLEMGMGAGWAANEHAMLGLPFPATPGGRIGRLAEACAVMKAPTANYSGAFYTLANAVANPKPVQRPYPPLWIGGKGERRLLRVVAEHADVWNAPGTSPEESARLSGALDAHCRAIGRDPSSIRRSAQFRVDGANTNGAITAASAYLERGSPSWCSLSWSPRQCGMRKRPRRSSYRRFGIASPPSGVKASGRWR